jgi:hypothetical protein
MEMLRKKLAFSANVSVSLIFYRIDSEAECI